MRISEVARRAGVGVETVRYYENRKLIDRPPRPENGGYRSYPPDTVRRIRFVRGAQQLGFSLSEIGDLLELEIDPGSGCADIRVRAETKRTEVSRKIDDLRRIGRALDRLIEACPGEGPARQCTILEALGSSPADTAMDETESTNG